MIVYLKLIVGIMLYGHNNLEVSIFAGAKNNGLH
ncbi:hypothetical protein SAMN05216498_2272 [Tenuibacillus multivorans]|uniref:Uncharacterized protein n=1 Tax=Tenuibacillus multivorans TaxID=237069 RepID=A0A1H0B9I7_9BACI|nr:hypothetical protein SAMN05216498_2272 [Tenuibacillus multivorans]